MRFIMEFTCQGNHTEIECSSPLPLICAYKDQIKYFPNSIVTITRTDYDAGDDPVFFDSRYDTVKRSGSGYRVIRGIRPSEEEGI